MLQQSKTEQLLLDRHTDPQTTLKANEPEYAIEFENVSRLYRLHHEPKLTLQDQFVNFFKKKSSYEDFWALKDVSFRLEKGKTLGIIGQNGAGKSTLLKLATNIISPTSGTIRVNGRVSAMLELGTGFHPDLSARDNIYLNGAFYGFSRKEMDERYDRIVEFSELGKFIDTPVKHFSSGMYMRLGFAIAITVEPDILIIDEVLAVGDAAFGRKCHQAIDELKQQSKAMLFVSHSAGEVSRFCDEVVYLSKGRIVAQGKPGDILDEYIVASMGPQYFTSHLAQNAATTATPVPEAKPEAKHEPKKETTPKTDPSKQPYRISNGVNELKNSWHFNLLQMQMEASRRSDTMVEYYLAVLNPNASPIAFDLTAYKRSENHLRLMPAGHFEVGPNQSMLLKLEDGATMHTNQLNLLANLPVAAEVIEYQPVRRPIANISATGANPALDWYFPYCDIRFENICRFELFNPSQQAAEIVVSLYRDGLSGTQVLGTFHCEPVAELTIDLNAELEQAGGEFYGGIRLQSTQPLIIERHAMQAMSPQYQLTGGAD